MEGVIDYVMQVPDGWRVKEVKDEYTRESYFDITAPVETAVSSGAAVSSGELKAVAVLEGGKSMVAKLEVSTSPFKKFTATAANAVIEKYNGVDKVLYGLSVFSDYSKETVISGAGAMLEANGNGVSDSDVNVPLAQLLGAELTTGERYVLWAIPVFFDEDAEESAWVVAEDLLVTYEFGAVTASVTVKDEDVLFNDVTVSVKLTGFSAYYGGTAVKTDDILTEILFEINNEFLEPYTEPMTYNGSAFAFPTAAANSGVEVVSEETYLTWIVPVKSDITEYTADDIIYEEYTLPGVTAGGSIKLTPGAAEIDRVSIKVPLSDEGATRFYYAFNTKRNASKYSTDAKRAEYLLTSGTVVNGSSAVASIDRLDPESTMVLFAMATDSKGKYGEVSVTEYTTDELVYNDMKVTLETTNLGEDNASVSFTVKGGTAASYVYWAGRNTDEFWVDLASNDTDRISAAQEYLALYPDDAAVVRAMSKYPMVNGKIELTELVGEATYNLLVLAVDSEGVTSKAGHVQFTTLAENLGTVVQSGTTEWNNAKAKITLTYNPESYTSGDGEFSGYSFNYQGPTDMTAYVVAGHKDYFEGRGYTMSIPEKIVDIRDYASRPIDGSYYADATEIYYDDEGNEHQGSIVDYVTYGTHGLASKGAITYFSSHHHDESNCEACEERANDPTANSDRSYEGQMATITAKTTLDYYKNVAKVRYQITNETYINKTAEGLLALYYDYYKDLKPTIYINDGSSVKIDARQGFGLDDEGNVQDAVIVVLRDKDNNYYEPMIFLVENHWK